MPTRVIQLSAPRGLGLPKVKTFRWIFNGGPQLCDTVSRVQKEHCQHETRGKGSLTLIGYAVTQILDIDYLNQYNQGPEELHNFHKGGKGKTENRTQTQVFFQSNLMSFIIMLLSNNQALIVGTCKGTLRIKRDLISLKHGNISPSFFYEKLKIFSFLNR